MTNIEQVEKNCGYAFKDRQLLIKALTLSSYDNDFNNQSLECLGDALLTFLVAEKYYNLNATEGEITKMKQALLSDEALRPVSERLGLGDALIRDKGDTHNKKAIPSAYEALTAAIYLDGGMDEARRFALSTLKEGKSAENFVAALQELLQGNGEPLPEYKKIACGTPEIPRQRVEVTVRGKTFFGEGDNFASAKRIAAQKAYEYVSKV